jgi:hypothetical protein
MLAWRSAFEFLNLVRCPRLHTTTLVAIRQSGLDNSQLLQLQRSLNPQQPPVPLGPFAGKPCDYGTVKIFPEYGSLTLLPEG